MSFPEIAPYISSQCLWYNLFYRVTADGSTLNIYEALPSDMGKYTCVATNPAGEEDRIFNLNVYGKYEISPSFDYAALGIDQKKWRSSSRCLKHSVLKCDVLVVSFWDTRQKYR